MKKIIFAFSLLFLLLGCVTGVKSTYGGLDSEAYLDFVGTPRLYPGGVIVSIDDKMRFKAEVNDAASNKPKGKTYAVSPGSRLIVVQYDGKDIYRKQLFLSTQETRRIELQ